MYSLYLIYNTFYTLRVFEQNPLLPSIHNYFLYIFLIDIVIIIIMITIINDNQILYLFQDKYNILQLEINYSISILSTRIFHHFIFLAYCYFFYFLGWHIFLFAFIFICHNSFFIVWNDLLDCIIFRSNFFFGFMLNGLPLLNTSWSICLIWF